MRSTGVDNKADGSTMASTLRWNPILVHDEEKRRSQLVCPKTIVRVAKKAWNHFSWGLER
jgi:hypothetical protein